jgi:hypothetical protein
MSLIVSIQGRSPEGHPELSLLVFYTIDGIMEPASGWSFFEDKWGMMVQIPLGNKKAILNTGKYR